MKHNKRVSGSQNGGGVGPIAFQLDKTRGGKAAYHQWGLQSGVGAKELESLHSSSRESEERLTAAAANGGEGVILRTTDVDVTSQYKGGNRGLNKELPPPKAHLR